MTYVLRVVKVRLSCLTVEGAGTTAGNVSHDRALGKPALPCEESSPVVHLDLTGDDDHLAAHKLDRLTRSEDADLDQALVLCPRPRPNSRRVLHDTEATTIGTRRSTSRDTDTLAERHGSAGARSVVELTRFRGWFTTGDHAGVSSRLSYATGER
jgi:hypothetical protein